jgi:hypothetical protein
MWTKLIVLCKECNGVGTYPRICNHFKRRTTKNFKQGTCEACGGTGRFWDINGKLIKLMGTEERR